MRTLEIFQQPGQNALRYFIVLCYFLGGLIGLYLLIPRAGVFAHSSWVVIFLYALMIGQNMVAIYGDALIAQKNLKVANYLYWLSRSVEPVYCTYLISYHSFIC